MVVIVMIILSLSVVTFIMLSDTRKNDKFRELELAAIEAEKKAAATAEPAGEIARTDTGNV